MKASCKEAQTHESFQSPECNSSRKLINNCLAHGPEIYGTEINGMANEKLKIFIRRFS